ncbi:MAG: glycerol-3-phosphate 1-O-acyltransferase PlsY [Chloroflexi bacterium]|nr:glycerol-3-phosphate 1-O-acyltransferase PlsY [Chloroflexota bacterium]
MVLGYLIGSIPSGVIISRQFGRRDIQEYGSGSTGATNALRTAGTKAGVMVFLADLIKGAAVVLLAGWLVGSRTFTVADFTFNAQAAQVLSAVAAIVGHIWSVFLRFRGGKGVSTFFGAFVVLSPLLAVICGAIAIAVIALFRYVSLGSLLGAVCAVFLLLPLVYLGWQPENYMLFALPSVGLILFRHRENIYRLLTGTERKLGRQRGA